MSGKRDFLIEAYVNSLDLGELYVIAAPGRCKIGHGNAKRAVRDAGDDATIAFRGFVDPRFAEILAILADERMRGRADIDADYAERCILFACEDQAAGIKTEEQLKAEAGAAVDHIEAQFDRLKNAGDLKEMNSRYREYRLSRNAAGEPAQPYPRWMWNQKVALVKKAAALSKAARGGARLKNAIAASTTHSAA